MKNAFKLPAEYVIHAVAPRYLDGSRGEKEGLQLTYKAICQLVMRPKAKRRNTKRGTKVIEAMHAASIAGDRIKREDYVITGHPVQFDNQTRRQNQMSSLYTRAAVP